MRNNGNPGMLLSPLGNLSHTSILYYYRIIYVKEIFENCRQVANKNQNTKLSKQTSKPQETQPKRWPHEYLVRHLTSSLSDVGQSINE